MNFNEIYEMAIENPEISIIRFSTEFDNIESGLLFYAILMMSDGNEDEFKSSFSSKIVKGDQQFFPLWRIQKEASALRDHENSF